MAKRVAAGSRRMSIGLGKKDDQATQTRSAPTLEQKHMERTDVLRQKASRLGTLRVTDVQDAETPQTHDKPVETDVARTESRSYRKIKENLPESKTLPLASAGQIFDVDVVKGISVSVTVAWLVVCVGYAQLVGVGGAPHELGAYIAGVCMPPVLLWVMLQNLGRRTGQMAPPINANEVEAMSRALEGQARAMDALMAKNIAEARDTLSALKDQEAALLRSMRSLSDQSDIVSTNLQTSLGGIHQAVETFSEETTAFDNLLKERAGALQSLTEDISGRMHGMDVRLETAAARLEGALSPLKCDLREEIGAVETVAERLAEVNEQTREQVRSLNDLAALQSGLNERISCLNNGFSKPIQSLQAVIDRSDEQRQAFESSIDERAGKMDEAGARALQSAKVMGSLLNQQTQNLGALSAKLSGQAQQMDAQLERQKSGWTAQIKSALEMLEQARSALSKEAMNLGVVSDEAAEHLSGARESMADVYRDIEMLNERAAGSFDRTREAAESIRPVMNTALGRAEDMADKLHKLGSVYQTIGRDNLNAISDMNESFAESLDSIRTGTQSAQEMLRSSGESFTRITGQIEKATGLMHEKVRDISVVLDGYAGKIDMLTGRAANGFEKVQDKVTAHYGEFSAYLDQVLGQMQDVGTVFVQYTDTMQTQSDEAIAKLAEAGEKAREETASFATGTHQSMKEISILSEKTHEEFKALMKRTKQGLDELRKDSEIFIYQGEKVVSQFETSLNDSRRIGQEIKAHMNDLAGTSSETVKRMGKAVSAVHAGLIQVGEATGDITTRIESVSEKIKTEAEELIGISEAALEASYDTTLNFKKQSETLLRASRKADKALKEIENTIVERQRDEFLSSAKFVIENLHSMSVDLTRMAEGGIPEKTWKRFEDGDVAAFTRVMLEIAMHWPMEKAREKFRKDEEFRTAVMKYIMQFEGFYAQAMKNDLEGLLKYTLATSEVGKLYRFLCGMSGRQSKLDQRDRLSAA